MKTCEACDRPWPNGKEHPGYFALYDKEDPADADSIGDLVSHQGRLNSQMETLFHAIFCVWKYDTECQGEIENRSIDNLTTLGQMLCREIARYESRIFRAARRAKEACHGSTPDTPQTRKLERE